MVTFADGIYCGISPPYAGLGGSLGIYPIEDIREIAWLFMMTHDYYWPEMN